MSTDFNNGLIIGLSLQGTIFSGGIIGDIRITEMESSTLQLKVKYNDNTEWTIFNYSEVNGVITFFCLNNEATVILTPTIEIYREATV